MIINFINTLVIFVCIADFHLPIAVLCKPVFVFSTKFQKYFLLKYAFLFLACSNISFLIINCAFLFCMPQYRHHNHQYIIFICLFCI